MAEQADALASGASGGNPVEVQFLLAAPILSGARGCGGTADASAGGAGESNLVWVQVPPTAPNQRMNRIEQMPDTIFLL